ncbi:TPA: hypothetical protein ACMDWR_002970 [Vibrio cholerae]|uniref:hypothetical protein n=1 Tax=Vibrio cholerae TaxID=666 RepID=UPI001583A886|nr:hypothetical protein [Vibrio cholerae]EJL8259011.1 hypothetical protein [Vibrio cholerae]QKU58294.1 hypothetical protein HPY11_00670 [Vibrio cholerae]
MNKTEKELVDKGLFRANNIRYLRFYAAYISAHADIRFTFQSQDKEELQRKIKLALNNQRNDLEPKIEDMNKQALKSLLADRSFAWIDKKEDRIVYFAWSLLRFVSTISDDFDDHKRGFDYTFGTIYCKNNLHNEETNPYQKSGLNQLPLSRIEAHELIYEFFDQWQANTVAKDRLMSLLKEKWIYIANELRPDYSWIDPKNKKQNIWIYNYIKSKLEFLPHLTPPISTAQYYNTNIALLDTLFTCRNGAIRREKPLPRELELSPLRTFNLLSNEVMYTMMKAWKQKQYREKTGRASAKS